MQNMWRETQVRIELPDDADVALGDLETFLDYAVEKVARFGTAEGAEVIDGPVFVVFGVTARVPVDPMAEKKPRPKGR